MACAEGARYSRRTMDKKEQIREELDEWLAEGKIDRETYDRLLAEQLGERAESVTDGLFAGSAAWALGEALGFYLIVHFQGNASAISRWSLVITLILTWVGMRLRRGERGELGRSCAIVASSMWTWAALYYLAMDFPPYHVYLSTAVALIALGHYAIGYLTTSSLAVLRGCFWLWIALVLYLLEWDDGRYRPGDLWVAYAALGGVYLVAAREHLVLRWPGGGLAVRFARAYHIMGLELINWSAYAFAWFGRDGDGYRDVGARVIWVTATVVLFGLEVWAGQKSRMPWVATLGVAHFLLQIWGILSYPYISLEQRALLVIGVALLLILVAQGDSRGRSH